MAESAVGHADQLSITSLAPNQRKRAIAALLVVTSVWGATFIWMKQALNELQPEIEAYGSNRVVGVLVAARFAIAALVMVIFFPKARAALGDKEQWKGGALLGGVMLVGFVTQMIGLDEINPAVSAFLTSLYVVFTALITIFMTKSQPSRVLMFGVLLATFGAGFIQGPPHLTWGFGEVMTVVCAVFFAGHVLIIGYFAKKIDPIKLSIIQFFVAGLLSLGIAISLELITWAMITTTLVPLLYAGVMSTGVAYTLQVVAQQHAHSSHAAIILSLEGAFALLGGWLLLDEQLPARGLFGCALMLAGMLFSQLIPSFRFTLVKS